MWLFLTVCVVAAQTMDDERHFKQEEILACKSERGVPSIAWWRRCRWSKCELSVCAAMFGRFSLLARGVLCNVAQP